MSTRQKRCICSISNAACRFVGSTKCAPTILNEKDQRIDHEIGLMHDNLKVNTIMVLPVEKTIRLKNDNGHEHD